MTAATPEAARREAALVARCRVGDQAAWNELIAEYARYVRAILVQGFRFDETEAQDVFQEVCARMFQKLDGLRDDGALRPWVAQLTRRIAIDRIRARRPEDATDVLPEQGSIDDGLDHLAEAMAVRQELRLLPEPCAEMLDRFYARDESYRTIGQALGIATGTVSSRMARCLERLRRALESADAVAVPGVPGGR